MKLRRLPQWVQHRRHIAQQFRSGLEGVGVIRTAHREALRTYLKEQGVETLVHWPKPIWEHWALGLGEPDLPNTRRICREVLSLPMSAETSDAHVDSVVDAVRRFFGTR